MRGVDGRFTQSEHRVHKEDGIVKSLSQFITLGIRGKWEAFLSKEALSADWTVCIIIILSAFPVDDDRKHINKDA